MLVSPITRPSLAAQVLEQLRALVVRGDLTPATHLVEGKVAEEFGVSRGPVRDALHQLEIEGLVEPRSRGVSVRGLDDDDLRELYALRGALEGLAIRETIARRASADWSVLDATLETMRQAADDRDPTRFAAADLDFHSAFYELSDNRRLAAAWATHRPLFAAMLDVTNTRDRDLHPTAQDHANLAELIRTGATEPLFAMLDEHLAGSHDRMRASLAELPGRHRRAS
ncbi:GntR family transcriptional regulator [Streptomyces sp. NPDC055400]